MLRTQHNANVRVVQHQHNAPLGQNNTNCYGNCLVVNISLLGIASRTDIGSKYTNYTYPLDIHCVVIISAWCLRRVITTSMNLAPLLRNGPVFSEAILFGMGRDPFDIISLQCVLFGRPVTHNKISIVSDFIGAELRAKRSLDMKTRGTYEAAQKFFDAMLSHAKSFDDLHRTLLAYNGDITPNQLKGIETIYNDIETSLREGQLKASVGEFIAWIDTLYAYTLPYINARQTLYGQSDCK